MYTCMITVVAAVFFVLVSVITDFSAFCRLMRRLMKMVFRENM